MTTDILFTSAGPAELAAAALLAKAGRKPLVLEPSAAPGGWAGTLLVDGRTFPRFLAAATGFEPDLPVGLLLSELLAAAPVLEMEGEVCLHARGEAICLEDLDQQAGELDGLLGAGFSDFLFRAREAWLPAWQDVLAGKEPVRTLARDIFRGSPQAWSWLDGLARILAGSPLESLSLPLAALALEPLWRALYLPQADLMKKLAGAVEFYNGRVLLDQGPLTTAGGRVQSRTGEHAAARIVPAVSAPGLPVAAHYLICEDVFDPDERLWHFTASPSGIVLLQVLPGEDDGQRKLVLLQPLNGTAPYPKAQTIDIVRSVFPSFSSGEGISLHTETLGEVGMSGEMPALPRSLPLAVELGRRLARRMLEG